MRAVGVVKSTIINEAANPGMVSFLDRNAPPTARIVDVSPK